MNKIYIKMKEAGYTKNEIKYIKDFDERQVLLNDIFQSGSKSKYYHSQRLLHEKDYKFTLIGELVTTLCEADEMFFIRHDGVRDSHKYTAYFHNRRVSDFETLLEALLCTMICYYSGEYKEWI